MIKNQKLIKSIASERIATLLDMAKERTMKMRQSDTLAKRYVGIAEKMATHYQIPRNGRIKYEVCRKCKSSLVPGINCTVRLSSRVGYIAVRCSTCGNENHIFYKDQGGSLNPELSKYHISKS